jgi:hypothetical protein
LFQGGFQIIYDLLGQEARIRKVGGVFKGIVLEPEDVEVGFVAFGEFVVGEGFEAVGFGAGVACVSGGKRALQDLLKSIRRLFIGAF